MGTLTKSMLSRMEQVRAALVSVLGMQVVGGSNLLAPTNTSPLEFAIQRAQCVFESAAER
jgi:hypothetical protein